MPRGSCKNRHFGGIYRLHPRKRRLGEQGTTVVVTLQRASAANVVPSSSILVKLMMEAIRSSETLVLTRVIRRTIREDGILHST
jgi:hypothetical protein